MEVDAAFWCIAFLCSNTHFSQPVQSVLLTHRKREVSK